MSAVPPGACNCCTECSGELTFTGDGAPFPFTMHRQAWCLTDLSELWLMPSLRAANVIISGTRGRRPYAPIEDETDFALPFIISGVVDENDAATTLDENEQLERNIALLRSTVLDPDGAATKPASLTSPDGSQTFTADIQVLGLVTRYRKSGLWVGTLHVRVPYGGFVAAPTVTNDDFANATVLVAEDQPTLTGDNTGFTSEVDEPIPVAGGGDGPWQTAWWTFTAPADGDITLDLTGSGFDTVLALYSGGPTLADLVEEASDDDGSGGMESLLTATVTNGTTYWVQVCGYDASNFGAITMAVTWAP